MPGDQMPSERSGSRPRSTIEGYVSGTVQERDVLAVMTSRVDVLLKG